MKSKQCEAPTIVAISTPRGIGGIGIVRMSGPASVAIARALTNEAKFTPRTATFVTIDLGSVRDTAIALYFPAPHSFTGEDIVELQCHGNPILLEKIVARAFESGATMALAGEFTRRAILNGKMNLMDAEALGALLHAECDAELAAAMTLGNGELHTKLIDIEKKLIEISARIEAILDHPEEVEGGVGGESFPTNIKSFIKTLEDFICASRNSHYIFDGINVAILGRPNAGKSSLFNALLGLDRSIVTDIAGTTTDVVSETVQIGGYKVRLHDTAGLRDATNPIEKLGVERTLATANSCDIAIVFDDDALALVKSKPHIMVKRDTKPEKIKDQILKLTVGTNAQSRAIANTRQLGELEAAASALQSALAADTPDVLASDVQTALFHIGNITGTNAVEAVLDEIFSRFCLGK